MTSPTPRRRAPRQRQNTPSTGASGTRRLLALDVARALAVFGMIVVNVGPYTDSGWASWIVRALNGRASILFVVLAGIGVSMLARRSLNKGVTRRSTLLWRGFLLLVIGLLLQAMDHDVNVILATYAALFFLAAYMVKMRARWLIACAILSALGGPVLWILARQVTHFHIDPAKLGDNPLELVSAVVLSGPYPLVVWIAPFFLGVWLGRQDLGERRLQLRLIVYGAVAGVGAFVVSEILVRVFGEPQTEEVGFDRLISAVGHSQMPLWLISSTGTSLLLLGLLLRWEPPFAASSRIGSWMVTVLATVGRMPLTAYTLHLVVIALFVHPLPETSAQGMAISLAIMAGTTLFAVAWFARFRNGPLEEALRHPPRFIPTRRRR